MIDLPDGGLIEGWSAPRLELIGERFPDYLYLSYAYNNSRGCSEKLRDIIDKASSPEDQIQWLPFHIYSRDEERVYYLLHFVEVPDLIDWKASFQTGGRVVKPIFNKAKLGKHRVFTYPTDNDGHIYVLPEVKEAIEAAQCKGLDFYAATAR
jgi:hypothetical protein